MHCIYFIFSSNISGGLRDSSKDIKTLTELGDWEKNKVILSWHIHTCLSEVF